jgi:hypothetical protein
MPATFRIATVTGLEISKKLPYILTACFMQYTSKIQNKELKGKQGIGMGFFDLLYYFDTTIFMWVFISIVRVSFALVNVGVGVQ